MLRYSVMLPDDETGIVFVTDDAGRLTAIELEEKSSTNVRVAEFKSPISRTEFLECRYNVSEILNILCELARKKRATYQEIIDHFYKKDMKIVYALEYVRTLAEDMKTQGINEKEGKKDDGSKLG